MILAASEWTAAATSFTSTVKRPTLLGAVSTYLFDDAQAKMARVVKVTMAVMVMPVTLQMTTKYVDGGDEWMDRQIDGCFKTPMSRMCTAFNVYTVICHTQIT